MALVEDGHHQLARVEVLTGAEFEAKEPELLGQAREWMPSLPFPEIDVLVLDEIGKNVSGAGMDTNIVGRGVNGLPREDRSTSVRTLFVRGLTPESHGNAVGMGLADVVRTRLVAGMDPKSTYTNALSAMTPAMVRTPMHFPSDAECLQAAMRLCGAAPEDRRASCGCAIPWPSTGSWSPPPSPTEVRERDDLRVVEASRDWGFDAKGDIAPDLLAISRGGSSHPGQRASTEI